MSKLKGILLTEGMHGMLSQVEGLAKALDIDFTHHKVELNNLWKLIPPKFTPISQRVYKKIMKTGYPNSEKIKSGLKSLKFHLDYLNWLLERRKWIACDLLTVSDFTAASHLSSLDYINDVNWDYFPNVKDWYSKIKSRPAFRPILTDLLAGFIPPEHYNNLDF